MEFILIRGERVQVPPEIVSEGRDAVAAWHAEQLSATKGATSVTGSTKSAPTREE